MDFKLLVHHFRTESLLLSSERVWFVLEGCCRIQWFVLFGVKLFLLRAFSWWCYNKLGFIDGWFCTLWLFLLLSLWFRFHSLFRRFWLPPFRLLCFCSFPLSGWFLEFYFAFSWYFGLLRTLIWSFVFNFWRLYTTRFRFRCTLGYLWSWVCTFSDVRVALTVTKDVGYNLFICCRLRLINYQHISVGFCTYALR